jgi:hypothetical protein
MKPKKPALKPGKKPTKKPKQTLAGRLIKFEEDDIAFCLVYNRRTDRFQAALNGSTSEMSALICSATENDKSGLIDEVVRLAGLAIMATGLENTIK